MKVMKIGKGQGKALAQQLIAGTQKHLANVAPMSFGGGTFTPVQITASLHTLVDLRTAVEDAQAAAKAKVVAEATQAPALRTQMDAYVSYVKVTFGNQPDVLADFGLKPRKARAPLTASEQTAANAKRAATRAARHTMGTQQKKQVKGTVTTIVTTPAAPAAPPVASSPAASAPATGASTGTAPHAG
jgi:hypothetical protein